MIFMKKLIFNNQQNPIIIDEKGTEKYWFKPLTSLFGRTTYNLVNSYQDSLGEIKPIAQKAYMDLPQVLIKTKHNTCIISTEVEEFQKELQLSGDHFNINGNWNSDFQIVKDQKVIAYIKLSESSNSYKLCIIEECLEKEILCIVFGIVYLQQKLLRV